MISLNLVNQSKHPMPRAFLKSWVIELEKALKACNVQIPRKAELTIVFLDPKPARDLNQQYRGRNYATDVLSFLNDESPLGDLVLCPEVLKTQAVDHELSFREELGYMVIHGTLHLLGFDHENTKKEARLMFQLQDAIFARLLAVMAKKS